MKSKVVEVTATVGQTIQVKQYEPRTYQATVKIEVDPTETSKDVFIEARRIANEEVENYFNNLSDKMELKKNKVIYTGVLKPEILTHPNIPKPLHGINPRTIMGQTWWNKTRQAVYATTDYHCVACGIPKLEARGHTWLEAHEFWNIDYTKGIAEVVSIEPLCHYCHNFIHSGRLSMIMGKEKSESEVKDILEHGFKVLANNNLKCFPSTLEMAENLGVKTFGVESYDMPESNVEWGDWKLIFDGNEYKSQFKDMNDWREHYDENKK